MASIPVRCPASAGTEGVVRNGKSTAGHQRYLCKPCRKTWQLTFTYTTPQPGNHLKLIDMAMNGVGCRVFLRLAIAFFHFIMGISYKLEPILFTV